MAAAWPPRCPAPSPGAISSSGMSDLDMLEFGIGQMDLEFMDWHRAQREKS